MTNNNQTIKSSQAYCLSTAQII